MTIRPVRRGLVLLSTAGLTAGLVPALAGGAAASTNTTLNVLTSGLNNPRGMAYVPADAEAGTPATLYVAENGAGGAECVAVGEPQDPNDPNSQRQICHGDSGSITAINLDDPDADPVRVVTGLPSYVEEDGAEGNFAVGPSDVDVAPDGTLRIIIGWGAHPDDRADLGENGQYFGWLIEADTDAAETTDWTPLVDVAQYEADNDPVEGEHGPDSNPYSVLALDAATTLVVDAGGNTLLSVTAPQLPPPLGSYAIEHVETFPSDREAEAPEFLGAPPGTMIPFESVPTSVRQVADRSDDDDDLPEILVTELTGFPFPENHANVYEVDLDPETAPEVLIDNLSTIADVAERDVDPEDELDSELYVAEFSHNGLDGLMRSEQSGEPAGAVVRTRPNGTQQSLLVDDLLMPGGVAVDDEGLVYLTNNGILAGEGEVVWFDPSLAGDPAIQSACPPDQMPGPMYQDIELSPHEEAIVCLTWWGVAQGFDEDSFGPQRQITRAQVASLVTRLLDETDKPAPQASKDFFVDDNGGTHEANTNRLAEADIIKGKTENRFAPTLDVTRAELASIAVRAYEYVTGESLPAGDDEFSDDEQSVHEANINKAAALGWVGGYVSGEFRPQQSISRAQSASLLARMLSDLVDEELAQRT